MAENENGATALLHKRNVLIPVDDTDGSQHALDWTLENFYREGDEIHIFHVIPIPMPEVVGGLGGFEGVLAVEPDPREDVRHVEQAKDFLHRRFGIKLEEKNVAYKIEIVRFLTDNDSIGEAVCKRAEAINAQAIVMAHHNKGMLKELFLGSVTRYCSQHSKQAVIVLH